LQGCFNPTLGQIWTNSAIGLHFLITFLTQRLNLFFWYHCWKELCCFRFSWKPI